MAAISASPITAQTLKKAFEFADFIEIPASIDEFWQLIELPEYRIEYHNHQIVGTMSYASTPHETIVSNVSFELRLLLNQGNLKSRIFGSNRPIYAVGCGNIYEADVHAIQGELKEHEYKKVKTATSNPTIIIEVHSKSTKNFDITEKLDCYKTIPSVQQILYIDSETLKVTVHNRTNKPDHWLTVDYREASQQVKVLNKNLLLSKIYQDTGLLK